MIHLDSLQVGECARIVGFSREKPAYRHKLMAMGLTRGEVIKVIRLAPLGDPIEIEVRGTALCVRKQEAAPMLLEKVSSTVTIR